MLSARVVESMGSAMTPNFSTACSNIVGTDQPSTEETAHEARDRGLKKSRSKEDGSSGLVVAGVGILKDRSKSNHVGVMHADNGSETVCKRLLAIPLGRLGRGESESLSDKRRFLRRGTGTSVNGGGLSVSGCALEDGLGSFSLKSPSATCIIDLTVNKPSPFY